MPRASYRRRAEPPDNPLNRWLSRTGTTITALQRLTGLGYATLLRASWGRAMRPRTAAIVAAATQGGVSVLDLTERA